MKVGQLATHHQATPRGKKGEEDRTHKAKVHFAPRGRRRGEGAPSPSSSEVVTRTEENLQQAATAFDFAPMPPGMVVRAPPAPAPVPVPAPAVAAAAAASADDDGDAV